MPRGKKKGVNRSAEIRALFEKHPKMKTDEVAATLGERGIKVSKQLVYIVRAKMGHRRRKARRAAAISAGVQAGVQNPVQLILEVRALAEKTGGVKQLKQLVDALAG